MSVRVRFAPSPTGYLHVGGLRTALYNYLFARHHGGTNILRIEDTDQTRFVEGAEQNIVEVCRWAGIEFDESPIAGGPYGPYKQSERLGMYASYARMLLDNGTAYYAFDTSEELDQMRERQQKAGIAPKYDRSSMRNQYTLGPDETQRLLDSGAPRVVRLKVPLTTDVRFHDLIRGEVIVNGREIDDQILLKSDGFPTYHLANVVDDYLMKITHVIRGEEWLPSTPKHVLLYQAFGWPEPKFAHLPLLLNEQKQKLSKRHGDVAVEDFRAKGYFPGTMINFVALLGWNPTADQEIFSMEELIRLFSLEKVNKAGAVFDRQKLDWMNSQYLRKDEMVDEYVAQIMPMLEERGWHDISPDYAKRSFLLLRERIHFLREFPDFGNYMFTSDYPVDEEYKAKHWNKETAVLIKGILGRLEEILAWDHVAIEVMVKAEADLHGVKPVRFIHPLRLILTGKSVGASLYETMEILGKDEVIRRIEHFYSSNIELC